MNVARTASVWILPAAIIGWVFTASMAGGILPLRALLPLAVFAALAWLFVARLQRGEYSFLESCIIAALTLAQPALFFAIGGNSGGIWLAGGIYAIAASAQTFARREDARSVMQLGGSLAVLQILDPLGGLIVAALLPGLFGLNRKDLKLAQSAGLYALVLFMPVIAAFALVYLSRAQHVNIPEMIIGPAGDVPASIKLSEWIAGDFVPLLIVAPVLLRNLLLDRHWARSSITIVLIACAISLAALIATFSGTLRSSFALAAAAAPLPLLAIAEWPRSPTRMRDGVAVAVATAVLAWILAP